MPLEVFVKTLRDGRTGLIGWSLALAAVTMMYAAFYPSIGQEAFAQAMEAFPAALMEAFGWHDLTSPAGYLGSTVFGLLAAILLTVYAIGLGAGAIAGDEEAGTLDLLLSHPVSRTAVVVQRALAMAVSLVVGAAAVFLATVVLRGPAQLEAIPIANVAAASLQLALLALTIGSVALAVGAFTGSRGASVGAAAAVATFGYFANTIAAQLDATAFLRSLSPFRYALGGEPLRHGLRSGDALVLLAASVVVVAIAVVAFRRRDLGA